MNLMRRVTNLHRSVALNKRILICLADNEVSGARRVLSQSLRDGLSAKAMLHRLEQAFNGKYRAGGHSDKEFDMAILAMRLGGQALLVALHQGAGFPGATTVYEKIRQRSVSDSTAQGRKPGSNDADQCHLLCAFGMFLQCLAHHPRT